MRQVTVVAVLLLLGAGSGAPQGSVVIHSGFFRAQSYFDMNADEQRLYVTGALDGMYLAPQFGAPENNEILMRIEKCVEGMKGSQVAAIVLKYAQDHPERWHWDLKEVTYNGILDVCPAAPSRKK